MKIGIKILFLISILGLFLLSACSNDEKEVTLSNENNTEVHLPGDRPSLIFFFTTYT
ncbi:hypothetical protein RZN22_04045 [Bacillaceae bacterium S4-13-58]